MSHRVSASDRSRACAMSTATWCSTGCASCASLLPGLCEKSTCARATQHTLHRGSLIVLPAVNLERTIHRGEESSDISFEGLIKWWTVSWGDVAGRGGRERRSPGGRHGRASARGPWRARRPTKRAAPRAAAQPPPRAQPPCRQHRAASCPAAAHSQPPPPRAPPPGPSPAGPTRHTTPAWGRSDCQRLPGIFIKLRQAMRDALNQS